MIISPRRVTAPPPRVKNHQHLTPNARQVTEHQHPRCLAQQAWQTHTPFVSTNGQPMGTPRALRTGPAGWRVPGRNRPLVTEETDHTVKMRTDISPHSGRWVTSKGRQTSTRSQEDREGAAKRADSSMLLPHAAATPQRSQGSASRPAAHAKRTGCPHKHTPRRSHLGPARRRACKLAAAWLLRPQQVVTCARAVQLL